MEAAKVIGSLIAKLSLDASDFNAGMDKAKSKLSFSEAVEKTGTAFAKLGATATAAAGLTLKSAIDFEDAFIGVRKTVDAPPGSNANAFFDSLRKDMFNMASEVPSALEAIAGVYEIGGQLGIEAENLTGFSRAMIDLSNSTNLTSEAAAVGFAKLANVTGTSQTEFTNLGSALVKLGNNLATSESEILDITQNIALAGTQAGMSAPELMGWGGAMKSLGLESASAGTAFSRFTNQVIQDVAAGGKNLGILAKTSGMTADEFSKAFKEDASGALQTFLSGLGQLGSDEQLAVFDSLGIAQMREIETLGALANNTDLVTKAIGLSTSAYQENTALSEEAAQRYAGLKSQLGMLRNDLNKVAIAIGEALIPTFQGLLDWLRPVVQGFGEWVKANPNLIAGIIKVGMVIGGLGVAMLTVLKVISVVKTVRAIFTAFAGIGKLGAVFAKLGGWFASAGKAIVSFAATAGKALWGLIVGMGPIGWTIMAIAAVVGLLFLAWKNNWFGMRDILNDFWNNTLKPFFEKVGEVFQKIAGWLTEIWGKISGFFASVGAIFASIGEAVLGFFGSLFGGLWSIVSGLGEIFGAIWGVIAGAFAGVGEAIGNALQPILDWFISAPGRIAEAVSTWWNGVQESFQQFKNDFIADIENFDLKTAVLNLAAKIGEGIAGWWETVKLKFEEFWGSVKSWFGALGLTQVIKDLAKKVGDGVSGWWETVKLKFEEFKQSIFDFFGGVDLAETAKKIIESFLNGLKEAWDSVTGWVGDKLKGLFGGGDSTEQAEAGTATVEVSNMVAIDAFTGVPQSVLDSFEALNQKILALNVSIPVLNTNLGAATGMTFLFTTLVSLITATVMPAFTSFAAIITADGAFGLAWLGLIAMINSEDGTGLLQALTALSDYIAGGLTETFMAIEQYIVGKSEPVWSHFGLLLYGAPNSVFNALGEILGVTESTTEAMELEVVKIRSRLVPAFGHLSEKSGLAVGALEPIAAAASNVAAQMDAATTAIYGMIAAIEALNAMDGGIPLPGTANGKSPFRAEGGPVSAGQTYIVGERGPELFTPRRSGIIISNDEAFGGNGRGKTINIEIHDIYGDANLEARIRNGVTRGLREAEALGYAQV